MDSFFQVVYVSIAQTEPSTIADIVREARFNNHQQSITGLLVYDGRFFAQFLEGTRKDVERIMQKIYADPRHSDIHLVWQKEASKRHLDNWFMGYISNEEQSNYLEELWQGVHELESIEEFLKDKHEDAFSN